MKLDQLVTPPILLPSLPEQNRRGLLEWFLMGWMSFCHQTISVKALKGTQSTDPKSNQWPGLTLSSFTNNLTLHRRDVAAFMLRRFYHKLINKYVIRY